MLTSAYIHFPWCLKKCPYCDFASESVARPALPHRAYADAVIRELAARRDACAGRTLHSVFFGGGTPSLWAPAEVGRVLEAVRSAFDAEVPDLEITLECNPTSLTKAHALALRDVGVDRLSVGVQSLEARALSFLGRLHNRDEALAALRDALASVPRVSADLMFGVHGRSTPAFLAELDTLVGLGLRHVSAYALTIEPGTQFGALARKGRLPLAEEASVAESFAQARRDMAGRGLQHYEVSNFAVPGEESRHNLHYWRGGDYLGLGAGAVSCLAEGRSARRERNQPRPEAYMAVCRATGSAARPRAVEVETLDPQARIREALMLGLRTLGGVDLAALAARVGEDPRAGRGDAIARRIASGDLTLAEGHLRVPPPRWKWLDGIVVDLF